jgi:hypothetical protein
MQFAIVICGLDSIEARRWINNTLVEMVDEDNPDSLKPIVDGGTEGMTFSKLPSVRANGAKRIQGPIQGDITDNDFVYRMSTGYACPKRSGAIMYSSHNSTSTTALHRVGKNHGLGRGTKRFG